MYNYQNEPLYTELMSDIEKIKIEMIISHIILSKLSGQDKEFYRTWSSLRKRKYIHRLCKSGALLESGKIIDDGT